MIDLSVPNRQSVLAIVFLALRIVKSLGITQLVLIGFFVIRGAADGRLAILAVVIALLLATSAALAWWRYTFQLHDGELVVTKGVVRNDRLTVPVDRIQSLSIDQELFHRITGLVKVRVDTAGSSEAEFTIDAIDRSVAEELQRQTLATPRRQSFAGVPEPHVEEDPIVFAHGPQRLVLAALTSAPWGAFVVLAPLFALASQLGADAEDAVVAVDPDAVRWWWLPIGALVIAVLSVVLNIVNVIVQHWQLTLRAGPDLLRRTSGLLSTTSRASSPRRVQVVSTTQNPLQHRVGLRTVDLSSIGDGDLSLVGCDDDQVRTVHHLIGTPMAEQLRPARRVHRAEIWLAVRNTLVGTTIAGVLGVWLLGWWTLVVLLLVPWVWLVRRRHVRTARWELGDELVSTTHVIARRSEQALLHKANGVQITQSLFERRRGLGRVHLSTAAGTVSIGMIPIDTARQVRDVILRAAETDRRPWM